MNWTGEVLLRVTQRLRGSGSLGVLKQISAAPFAPPEAVAAGQWNRLKRLLIHAQARVPYYREVFSSLGISSEDIRSFKDFTRLPVLTKDIVRERLRDLIREDVGLSQLMEHHSGGSTGIPLTFYRDRTYMDASDAGVYRSFAQCGWRPGEMVAFFWGGNERLYAMPRLEFELRQRMRRMYQFDPFFSGPEDMERWLRLWPRLGFRVAHGYASTISRFAAYVEASGRRLEALLGVYTTAEKLYEPQRRVIERVFGCKVYDCYGSSEVQCIAAECPHGRMHVNADFVVLETEPGGEIPAQPVPFLVTSLWNYAMPFIRYRNEDYGELEEGVCGCGNNFPLLKLQIARTSDNFVLPNGRVVHGEFFTHLMYGREGIAMFQFHQTSPDSITLWIVPGPASPQARADSVRAVVDAVRALDPEGRLAVTVHETESIPLSAAGKHRFTRSDVAAWAQRAN